jgi:hypothetical protein
MLRRLDAGFSERPPGFAHRSIHVGFEADKVHSCRVIYQFSKNHTQTYRNEGKINVADDTTETKTHTT